MSLRRASRPSRRTSERTGRRSDGRVLLVDRIPTPAPDPVVTLRQIVAEALILQDRAESVLAGIAHGEQLGSAAPRGGPLVRRFFALADALPDVGDDEDLGRLCGQLQTIFVHHAMQVATALDFLAVAWRSEQLSRQVARIGALGPPAELLDQLYRELLERVVRT